MEFNKSPGKRIRYLLTGGGGEALRGQGGGRDGITETGEQKGGEFVGLPRIT